MLILQAEQVKYCTLIGNPADPTAEVPGLEYQHKLYIKGKAYDISESQSAIKKARQEYLTHKGRGILLVEDGETITCWYQEKSVRKVDSVLTIDLKKLVAEMRNVGGVQIKDRQYRLKTYRRCFVGSEAVDWLVHHLQISREKAVQLGQRLVDEKWIHHVVDQQPFQDEYFFYRFHWDEV